MSVVWKAVFKVLEVLLVAGLVLMSGLVLLNVILRYGFNSNIPFSVEVSRLVFVWITFIGAVIALKDNEHLSVDALVRRLPRLLRIACFWVSHALMLYCCWLIFEGSRIQVAVNWTNFAPISGISMGWLYAAGMFASVFFALILLGSLVRSIRHPAATNDGGTAAQ